MKKFIEPMHVIVALNKKNGPRKPLKTFKEMCDEFGVNKGQLRNFLINQDGPKPVLKHTATLCLSNSWYEPIAMRAWWKTVKK